MPAEAVGPIVADAIAANRFYIFTHPETVRLVQARHDEVLRDFAFYAARGVEDKKKAGETAS
jgi:hypothetical protein